MSNARNLANLLGTSTQVKTAKVANEVFQANKSLIINGDFAVWQRGTSFASPSDGDFTADRYKIFTSNDGDETISQSTDVPSGEGFQYSIKVDITTADTSIAAGQYLTLDQYIEGNVCSFLDWGSSNAKTITVSFWAKSALTGTYCYSIRNNALDRAYIKEFTIDTANTWEKKTITIEGDTTGTWLTTNGIGQIHQISLAMGSTYHGTNDSWQSTNVVSTSNQVNLLNSNSNNFYLTGWKVEEGTTETPFQHKSYAENLSLCKRYYQLWGTPDVDFQAYPMWTYTTGATATYVDLAEEMRATPTVTRVGGVVNTAGGQSAANTWAIYQTAWKGCAALTVYVPCKTGFRLDGTVNTAVTAGGACGLYGGTGCYYTLDAEL